MAKCHMDPKACGWEPDAYCNQLEPKLLLLEPVPTFVRSCCNVLAKPVPQEDANADKTNITCIPSRGCASVTCGNPQNVAEDFDTEDDRRGIVTREKLSLIKVTREEN